MMDVCTTKHALPTRAVCRNFSGGGGKFGVRTKEGGGGSLCEVLHPTLAGGGESDTRGGGGGGGQMPLPAPLNTALPTKTFPSHSPHPPMYCHNWIRCIKNEHVSKCLHIRAYVSACYFQLCNYVAVTGRSCGPYCACSSIIHKGTQKIWSDFNEAF